MLRVALWQASVTPWNVVGGFTVASIWYVYTYTHPAGPLAGEWGLEFLRTFA